MSISKYRLIGIFIIRPDANSLWVSEADSGKVVAMIINQGVFYRPYVLKEIRDPQIRSVITQTQTEVLRQTGVSNESFRMVQRALRSVVTEGTAKPILTTKVVDIAGKTVTAEIGEADRWHSWFVGYGPYHTKNPEEVPGTG